MKKLTIAIDGPAGAGKSTVAKLVAERLNYIYIDTGAMYRSVAWQALQKQQTVSVTEEKKVAVLAENMKLTFDYTGGKLTVCVDGINVTDAIRSPEVTALVPEVAMLPALRQVLVRIQQEMARAGGVVMDGRDIGTHVLPNADLKLFLTASIQERAKRRWLELSGKQIAVDLNQLTAEIAERDRQDSEREAAPLVQAADALLLDTTALSLNEVVQKIVDLCLEKAHAL
ncbi:MAG TPA: (d)CMP kinase [Patescibacteria group bacterium]|nr:(d)CMP kinase [Patescibacteria group bacterium]